MSIHFLRFAMLYDTTLTFNVKRSRALSSQKRIHRPMNYRLKRKRTLNFRNLRFYKFVFPKIIDFSRYTDFRRFDHRDSP